MKIRGEKFPKNRKMAQFEGEISNQLFETLEEWADDLERLERARKIFPGAGG